MTARYERRWGKDYRRCYSDGLGACLTPVQHHREPRPIQVIVGVVEGHCGDFLLSLIGEKVRRLPGRVVRHHVVDGGTVDCVDVPFADVIHQVLESEEDNEGEG